MAIEYILVDYENTQPKADEVALVRRASQRLWIFRGPGQKKYEAEFVEALLALGEVAKVVRCEKSGANALDMHIAFELGRLAAAAPAGAAPQFVVVSKDTDYEPLLQYLRKLGFAARREKTLTAALPASHGARAKSAKAATEPGKAEVAAKSGRAGANAAPPRKAAVDAPRVKTAARTAARPAEAAAIEPVAKQAKQPKQPKLGRQPAKKATKQPATRHPAAQPSHVTAMRASLEKQSARNRPTRVGSLRKWLENRQVPAAEVDAVIAALQAGGDLQVDGTKLTYPNFA